MFDVLPSSLRVFALAVVLIGGVASSRGSCRPDARHGGPPSGRPGLRAVPHRRRSVERREPGRGGPDPAGRAGLHVVPCPGRRTREPGLAQAGTDPGQGRQPGAAGLPPRLLERSPGRQAGDDHAPPLRRLARRGEGGDGRGAGALPGDDGKRLSEGSRRPRRSRTGRSSITRSAASPATAVAIGPRPGWRPRCRWATCAASTRIASLAAFLQDPLKVRPSGRMPALNLVKNEATELARLLARRALGKRQRSAGRRSFRRSIAHWPRRDERSFERVGCASCHQLRDRRTPPIAST